MKLWDGYTEFFKMETGKFLTGLLPEVRAALKKWDISYTVSDERNRVDFRFTDIDENFLNQWIAPNADKVKLHDYQVDFINKITKHHRGVVYAPTSAGKTFIMVGASQGSPQDCPTLVLQNRVALAQQNYERNQELGVQERRRVVGRILPAGHDHRGEHCLDWQDRKGLAQIPSGYRGRNSRYDVGHAQSHISAAQVVFRPHGLERTPFKFGETDQVQKFYVKGFFGPVLKTDATESGILTTKDLQDRGILAASECFFYPIEEPMIPTTSTWMP
jgi:hypothetical protein